MGGTAKHTAPSVCHFPTHKNKKQQGNPDRNDRNRTNIFQGKSGDASRFGLTLLYAEVIMEINFQEKFEEVLKEELKGFDIDWSLVEIKYIRYHFTLMEALPIKLDEYMVRMRVVGVEDKIPEMEIDNWFRSHKFIYGMMSKSVRTEFEEADTITFDIGTIESIAMKTCDAFRDFHRQ